MNWYTLRVISGKEKKIKEIINGAPLAPINGISGDITLKDAYCSQKKYINVLKGVH